MIRYLNSFKQAKYQIAAKQPFFYATDSKDPFYRVARSVRVNSVIKTIIVHETGRHSDLAKLMTILSPMPSRKWRGITRCLNLGKSLLLSISTLMKNYKAEIRIFPGLLQLTLVTSISCLFIRSSICRSGLIQYLKIPELNMIQI